MLPPVPTAYRSQPITPPTPIYNPLPTQQQPEMPTNKVRLIYTKSGFYLKSTNPMEPNTSIHGFLSIFSKSMVSHDILK